MSKTTCNYVRNEQNTGVNREKIFLKNLWSFHISYAHQLKVNEQPFKKGVKGANTDLSLQWGT